MGGVIRCVLLAPNLMPRAYGRAVSLFGARPAAALWAGRDPSIDVFAAPADCAGPNPERLWEFSCFHQRIKM